MNKKACKQKDKNRNSKGQFLPGKAPNPKGRPRGAKDKISKNIKDNFEAVFKKLGGIDGFCKWAEKNIRTQGAFYQMYSKMLPSNIDVEHKGEMTVRHQIETQIDEYFEEQGTDGIVKYLKRLEVASVPESKRTNH